MALTILTSSVFTAVIVIRVVAVLLMAGDVVIAVGARLGQLRPSARETEVVRRVRVIRVIQVLEAGHSRAFPDGLILLSIHIYKIIRVVRVITAGYRNALERSAL